MERNFKRFLSLALALLMVLSNVPVSVFAMDTNAECTHDNAVSNTVDATCVTAGMRTVVCSCGYSAVEEIPATGAHTYANGVCVCGAVDPDYAGAAEETVVEETEEEVVGDEAAQYNAGETAEAPELPTATVTEIENDGLTFAMNFKADAVTEEQLAYYGSWYADFVLTVNKDVTFNAEGGADGYLSGQYDGWSENWVKVPFEDTSLKANESLKIMAYAAEAMNQGGLKVTYNDIVTGVQDFDCGVFFEPEFLMNNQDLEVTLELRMYNPADESESYVIGETYTFTIPELPKAEVSDVVNKDLTFAMNFKATAPDEEQMAYYGDWYADFVLTINKDVTFNAEGGADGYLSGQYDGWSTSWVNVPFEDVTLTKNTPLKIMEYAAKAMNQSGLKVTYNDIVTGVQDFDCGIYFTPAFLKANPDLEVKLQLRVYNPDYAEESYTIGDTYTFTIPALPTATVSEIENDELTFAMNFKAVEPTGRQLAYYGDWYADFELTVNQDVTVNANGGADGYLSGQYDGWSESWVKVPFEDVTLAKNTPLKIMEYAAEAMNQGGLKVTYNDIVTGVQDFDCGMFFTEEYLKSLTDDLVVTLELRMYNPEDETENYKIGNTYTFTVPYTPDLPTATVTEIENDELTFAMNFKADEVSPEQLAYYGSWYADFELTVNKDVTFNANGGANGYLSGQYDGWSESWVKVPFENVTLKADKPLKIMAYAAEAMNQGGLKVTYNDIVTSVQDFDCGVFFEPEFLMNNQDLEVTLELRMYNPANESESYVIGETYTFTIPERPDADTSDVKNKDLTFAMNFTAKEPTKAQLAYYGDWYADFELTINKDVTFNAEGGADGYLSGQYDEWSENWVNVPFEDVTLKAGEPLKIMAYAAEAMDQSGLQVTYNDIVTSVKDFDCGIFFEPAFLKANPDLEVKLELRMYNPDYAEESYTIGDTYIFTIPTLPTATVTEIENEDLTFALNFLADDATDAQLAYYGDWYADFELTVNQPVTFNANGGANGYLSGQYDAWSENWVNVPFENVTLEADKPLKIMAYAAEMMNQGGLKVTYNDIVTSVKDFDCGVFFEPEFLMELEKDLVVTLELRMYNPKDETEGYTIGETYTFTVPVAPELPTATATEIENDKLTFAMNFEADEASEAQLAYYGGWYADFELTVNKDVTLNANLGEGVDGYLSGQYDAWSENWVNVPFENVTLKAGETLKIMEYAAELMGQPGLKYTYGEVYNVVKDFDCGMFFTNDFLVANPDLEVTLELRMYNPVDEEVNYVIGETYTFKNTYVAYNIDTDTLYTKVSTGTMEAQEGETVILLRNAEDGLVPVLEKTVLDLNGFELTSSYVTCYGDIIDSSEANSGVLKVPAARFLIQENNAQLPIKNNGGYQFVELLKYNEALLEDGNKFAFQPFLETYAHDLLLKGQDTCGVTINVRITWKEETGIRSQNFVYNDAQVAKFINSWEAKEAGKYGQMFTLTMTSTEKFQDLTFQAVVLSDTGVGLGSAGIEKEQTNDTAGNAGSVATDENNQVTEQVTIGDDQASALVPAGTQLEENTNSLTLTVTEMSESQSNITLGAGEAQKSVDVHIEGVSAENTVPMTITLKAFAPTGLNEGNLKLYHVEDGATTAMTQVFTVGEVDAHNEFYYDPATGDVTMALATFSEVAMTVDKAKAWEGNVAGGFNGGTGTEADPYIIANADQLAYMNWLVSTENATYGRAYYKLITDINFGGSTNVYPEGHEKAGKNIVWYPVGYMAKGTGANKAGETEWYTYGGAFSGTFDGAGHTITGIYQNTWVMDGNYDNGYYKEAMGLFGYVNGGTVKNLTIDYFYSEGEFAPTGCVTAYAAGEAIFENIAITNSRPQTYNTGVAGIVGWDNGGDTEAEASNFTFKNITVDSTNTISALWGSWDVAAAGLMGYLGEYSKASLVNCNVAATIDVYNDVCGNYQYYWYRYSGMLIGTVDKRLDNGKGALDLSNITATNCTVDFGDRHEYYYCEFIKNSIASYTHDYQFSRVSHDELDFSATPVVCTHEHSTDTEVVNGETVLIEDKRAVYIPYRQVFGGYGWGVKGTEIEDRLDIDDITVEVEAENIVEKFKVEFPNTANYLYRVGNKNSVSVSSLFAEKDDLTEETAINGEGVYVSVTSRYDDTQNMGTFTANASDWTQGTIKFTGTGPVKVTIQDYDYCKPTELYLEVVDATNVTTYSELKNQNSVLLNDITMSSDGTYYLSGASLYGNGFIFDVSAGRDSNTESGYISGNYTILLKNAILDNIQIKGEVYTQYGAGAKDAYNFPTVLTNGNNKIANSYISNGASPVRAQAGNLEIVNSTLEGGIFANLDVRGGTVTLDNVTTINQSNADGTSTSNDKNIVGLGIAFYESSTGAKVVLKNENSLTQYNWISENVTFTETYATQLKKEMFKATDYVYTDVNGVKWVNTGIMCISETLDKTCISGTLTGYKYQDATILGKEGFVYTYKPGTAAPPTLGTQGAYKPEDQYYIVPKPVFDHTVNRQDQTEGSNEYCTYNEDLDTVLISFDEGKSKVFDPFILTITKGSETLEYTVSMNGTEYSLGEKITFTTTGEYNIEYSYTDPTNYVLNEDGGVSSEERNYVETLHVSVTAVPPTAKDAVFTFYGYGSEKTNADITITDTKTAMSSSGNTYIMPSATGTYVTSIMIDGITVNCPVVHVDFKDNTSDFNWLYPVFLGVKIEDYADGGTADTATTIVSPNSTSKPSNLTIITTDKPSSGNGWSSGSGKSGSEGTISSGTYKGLYGWTSGAIGSDKTADTIYGQFSYQDNKGTLYYYVIAFYRAAHDCPTTCVTPDTLVTLADGTQKRIDAVTYEDQLLVWDFFKGEYAAVPAAIIFDHGYGNNTVIKLNFSDGTSVKVVNLHQFMDADLNELVSITADNVDQFVGHAFVKRDGESYTTVTLLDYAVSEEYIEAYGIISAYHYNILVEDMISTDFMLEDYDVFNYFEIGEDMKYDAAKMQADIEKYGLYTYADFADYLTYEQFEAFNVQYMKIAVGKGKYTYEGILNLIDEYLNK